MHDGHFDVITKLPDSSTRVIFAKAVRRVLPLMISNITAAQVKNVSAVTRKIAQTSSYFRNRQPLYRVVNVNASFLESRVKSII